MNLNPSRAWRQRHHSQPAETRGSPVEAELVTPAHTDLTDPICVAEFHADCLVVLEAVRQSGRLVTLDLRRVAAADTKLIASLVQLHVLARQSGARINLLISRPVREILELCRLECLIADDAI